VNPTARLPKTLEVQNQNRWQAPQFQFLGGAMELFALGAKPRIGLAQTLFGDELAETISQWQSGS